MSGVISFAKKRATWIFVALLVVCIIIAALRFLGKSNVSLYTVKRESITNTLQVNGNYAVASQTSVVSPTNGVITKIYVSNNDEVKADDPLFYVQSTATEDQKKAALAAYLGSKAALDADNAQLYSLQSVMFATWKKFTDLSTNSTYQNPDSSPNTTNRILTEFTTTQDDWLAAEANYKNQQNVISKDQAQLASTLQSYNETQDVTVPAPIAGRVSNFLAKVGDEVSAVSVTTTTGSTTTTQAPPILLIANFSNPAITVSVSEENIPKVHVGEKANIVFDAFPDKTFTGHVVGMDTVGTNKEGIISYNVRIDIDNLTSDVKPNMTASIVIETVKKDNILTVPNDAIIDKEGKTFVQKNGSDQNHLTEVTLGLKGLTKSEIVKGLTDGDTIILPQ